MRLIDADALMRKLTVSPCGTRYREYDCDNFPATLTLIEVKKMVKNEPTVAEGNNVPVEQPDPITGSVPCVCEYCDLTHGQRYLFRENKNAPYRGMISTVEIAQDDCKKHSQIECDLYDENGNNFYVVFDIRHCPMCGRKLTVTP